MDTTILVDKDIESGKNLIEYLDKKNLSIKAAMWLYNSELKRWYFIISSPLVESEGTRKLYFKIANIINKKRDNINFDVDDIRLVPYSSPLINLIKMAIQTGPGISGIRFQNNVISGQLIEDAYIYRML
jgi:hypothetical protein